MKANLDRRITIQVKTTTRDDAGGEVTTWADALRVCAAKADQGGREFRAAGTLLAETTTVFTIRHFRGLGALTHRISYDGTSYDILSVGEIGRRDGMIVQAKARAPQ